MDMMIGMVALAILALVAAGYVGFIVGRDNANKTMYNAMDNLINTWTAMIKRVDIVRTFDKAEAKERREPTLSTPLR